MDFINNQPGLASQLATLQVVNYCGPTSPLANLIGIQVGNGRDSYLPVILLLLRSLWLWDM